MAKAAIICYVFLFIVTSKCGETWARQSTGKDLTIIRVPDDDESGEDDSDRLLVLLKPSTRFRIVKIVRPSSAVKSYVTFSERNDSSERDDDNHNSKDLRPNGYRDDHRDYVDYDNGYDRYRDSYGNGDTRRCDDALLGENCAAAYQASGSLPTLALFFSITIPLSTLLYYVYATNSNSTSGKNNGSRSLKFLPKKHLLNSTKNG